MVHLGYFPIARTFNALINGFCRQGKVSSVLKLMDDMIGRGCILDITSYNPFIDALCRKGNFHKALELLSHMLQMGITPDYSS